MDNSESPDRFSIYIRNPWIANPLLLHIMETFHAPRLHKQYIAGPNVVHYEGVVLYTEAIKHSTTEGKEECF